MNFLQALKKIQAWEVDAEVRTQQHLLRALHEGFAEIIPMSVGSAWTGTAVHTSYLLQITDRGRQFITTVEEAMQE